MVRQTTFSSTAYMVSGKVKFVGSAQTFVQSHKIFQQPKKVAVHTKDSLQIRKANGDTSPHSHPHFAIFFERKVFYLGLYHPQWNDIF